MLSPVGLGAETVFSESGSPFSGGPWSLRAKGYMARTGFQRKAPEGSVLSELSTGHRGLEKVQFL